MKESHFGWSISQYCGCRCPGVVNTSASAATILTTTSIPRNIYMSTFIYCKSSLAGAITSRYSENIGRLCGRSAYGTDNTVTQPRPRGDTYRSHTAHYTSCKHVFLSGLGSISRHNGSTGYRNYAWHVLNWQIHEQVRDVVLDTVVEYFSPSAYMINKWCYSKCIFC